MTMIPPVLEQPVSAISSSHAMWSDPIRTRVISLILALALGGLCSPCQGEAPSCRVASARSAAFAPIEAVAKCSDDYGGFGADLRRFGNATLVR